MFQVARISENFVFELQIFIILEQRCCNEQDIPSITLETLSDNCIACHSPHAIVDFQIFPIARWSQSHLQREGVERISQARKL